MSSAMPGGMPGMLEPEQTPPAETASPAPANTGLVDESGSVETKAPATNSAPEAIKSDPAAPNTDQGSGDKARASPSSKITVRFRPMGATPRLKTSVFNVSSGYQFSALVTFLRKQLGFTAQRSLFCYVNGSFAPSLDANLDDLLDSYGEEEVLNIFYCGTVAFG